MLHSLSAQVSHYSDMIQQHSGWQYCGVYADEALTGTKDNRENFQRLLQECYAGKIDMIITKSISRFARNTVTLLQTVRELKRFGVDVYFEEQNIHTMSADGELMMTILASYAQEESLSASENQKWRIRKGFANGEMMGLRFMYGYHIKKGNVMELFYLYSKGCKALPHFKVVKGYGSKWEKGADTGLVFTANGAYSKFTGIEVDGKAVDKDNYTAVSGSTVITLKPEYLETLSVGAHTLTVQYTDGEASCEFTIVKKPAEGTDNDTQTPETGDNNNMALWITLMFIAACGLTGVMAYGRKKKYGK